MASQPLRVGVYFPHVEIEPDAGLIRDFGQTIEALGYSHVCTADHVIGANKDWPRPHPYDATAQFQEPLVLFSFLAGATRKLGFMPAVIIASQRQTVLMAQQAANLDIYCGGRLRMGVGTGWNQAEYQSLGVPFEDRAKRIVDQIRVLRRLWTETSVTEHSPFHSIPDVGLAPLPIQRPIPIWIGGLADFSMRRAARIGDGWVIFQPSEVADEKIGAYHEAIKAAGRDPNKVQIENIVHLGTAGGDPQRTPDQVVSEILAWHRAGAHYTSIYSMNAGLKGAKAHLDVLRYIAEALKLAKQPA